MWNVKTDVIPVFIGANGSISKSFRKHLTNLQGNQETTENSYNEHCPHTRTSESTSVKAQNIQHNCNYRIAATL